MRVLFAFSVLSFFLLFGCTRYNSNRVNSTLIQNNKWKQVEIVYPLNDSLVIESPEGTTYLSFTSDSTCVEEMPDLEQVKQYTYTIKDYVLELREIDKESNYLGIAKLTDDSLVLKQRSQYWKYIKRAD